MNGGNDAKSALGDIYAPPLYIKEKHSLVKYVKSLQLNRVLLDVCLSAVEGGPL